MSEELEGKLKVGLLAVIAIILAIQTFMMSGNDRPSYEAADMPTQNNGMNNQVVDLNAQPQTNTNPSVANPTPTNPTVATDVNKPTTSMEFETYDYDFGTVTKNSSTTKVFRFVNTGTNPLVITNAKGSCGCTVPDWPKEPIMAGGTGEITVTYSPGEKEGEQNNTVTLTANTNPPSTILRIKADVIPE